MDQISALDVAMRIVHLTGIVILVGAAIFARYVVMPASDALTDPQPRFVEAVRSRLAKLILLSVLAILVSGFYNYMYNQMSAHKGQAIYHALMGVKLILTFAVFFFASALTGKAKAFEFLRNKADAWMGAVVIAALIIIGLAAVLGAIPDVSPTTV